jgi:hypothetical protein
MSARKGGWIKWWKDTATDPRLMGAAEKLLAVYDISRRTPGGLEPLSKTESLDLLRNAVTGALQTLWCRADDQLDSNNTLDISLQAVDAVVHLEGFVAAMPREWLDEFDHGRRVVLPGYCEKNSLIVKKKRAIQSHERVKRYRARHKRLATGTTPANTSPVGNGVTSDHVTTLHRALDIDKDFKNLDKNLNRSTRERDAQRPSRRATLPVDFTLTEARREKALAKAPGCDVELWFETFRAHHEAKGSLFKNWDAAWRTWICHGVRFGYPRKQEGTGSANGLPVLNG